MSYASLTATGTWPSLAAKLGCSIGPQAQQYQPARRLARPRCQPLRPGLAARLQPDGPRSALSAPGAELDAKRGHGWRDSATLGGSLAGSGGYKPWRRRSTAALGSSKPRKGEL